MKSKYIFTAILLVGLGVAGCNDVLDKKNLNAVTAEDTWNDETLATAFLDKCYADNLPDWSADVADINQYSDEGRGGEDFFYAGQLTSEGGGGPTKDYWPYEGIYKLNVLLDNINTGTLSEDVRKKIEAQALFLRSYRYFELVKRYGGVPLILSVQDRKESEVPREKTSVCISQIVNDLSTAATVLPKSWSGSDAGRITRGAALALKGRVLLFYASKQFNRNNDAARWQAAYDANLAAKEQLEKDGYGLNSTYDGTWKDNSDASELSKEVIFSKRYSYPANKSDINAGVRPLDYSQGATGWNQPTLDLVLAYPMADGTVPGVDINGDGVKEPFDPTATDERRLKRRYGMFIHYRNPHQQGVSMANERMTGETEFRFLSCRFHTFVIYCHPVSNRLRMNFILGNTSINETSRIIFIAKLNYLCYLCPEPTRFPKAGCPAERRNPENFRGRHHGLRPDHGRISLSLSG